MKAISVLPEIFRQKRYISGTASVPHTAEANLQPNGVIPNAAMPSEIIVFPSGGCVVSYIGRSFRNS